jgi:N-acetylglutamate synthase-like GNAT family acetyltransferase
VTAPSASIRKCDRDDFESIYAIINDAAEAYRGVIPSDCWKDPYMSKTKLQHEINAGVDFWGYQSGDELVGVMGIQSVQDVALIRHAYVRTSKRNHGIGGALLSDLRRKTNRPILVGTWAAADWAIKFYEKHGFQRVSEREKDELLSKYWTISSRQIETSIVLGDSKWREVKKLQT